MFRIEISPDALKELSELDKPIKRRITDKIEWLAGNVLAVTHHHLTNLPRHLSGLCKRREGDYRILYYIGFTLINECLKFTVLFTALQNTTY
jgi:mRNA interferase RelE/StbE